MVDVLFDVKISLTFLNEFTPSREEFVGPERPPKKGLDTDAKAELAFNVFDKNHDGFITKNEMLRGSKNLTKEQVSKIRLLSSTIYFCVQLIFALISTSST